jgi:hypothetical protein
MKIIYLGAQFEVFVVMRLCDRLAGRRCPKGA